MQSMRGSVNTSSEDMMRVWTAAELGKKPAYCPICGVEKTWRKATIMGATLCVTIMCECEVKRDEEEQRLQEAREKQERIDRIMAMSNLGERFARATFDNWLRNPQTENCYETVKRYADSFNRDVVEGLCIYGVPGNGKSHLAAALVHSAVEKGYTAVFIEAPDLFAKIKASYNDGTDGISESKILNALSKCDLLVLDDAGAEKPTAWVQEKFYQIINARYKNHLPLVITTNTKDMAGLEEVIGFRAYDRVLEMCRPVKNNGSSYRRSIAVERLRNDGR